MIIRKNGDIVEVTNSRNDLHNTFSVKHHAPHFVPSYKNLYHNQLKTNKGLLLANGVLALITLGVLVGCSIRVNGFKTEINGLERLRVEELEKTEAIIIRSNEIEAELASCSAKLQEKKLSPKAKAHVKQQPVVAEKIKYVFGSEWAEATELFSRESSLNPQAINPSSQACGIVQALPCSKLVNTCSLSDIDCQLNWGKNYIKSRYGTAAIALAHSDEKGWY